MGIPGRSYAMAVASQMGLPEEIMEKARSLLEPQHLLFEDWLNELQNDRHQLHVRLEEAEKARAKAETLRQTLDAQLDNLVSHREDILDSIRRELLARYEEIRRKLRRAEAAASWSPSTGDLSEVRDGLSTVRRELESQRVSAPAPRMRAKQPPISIGDVVDVRGLNLQGTVASLSDEGREAEVNVGNVQLRIELSRLSRVDQAPDTATPEVHVELGPSLASMELDLRGLRAEEAVMRLEEFLDKAVRDGLGTVRIIHGHGTGVLRQVVREHLERHPLARTFGPEARERGGNGATTVELA
jgi:DNA mismatch repair protein MutS2